MANKNLLDISANAFSEIKAWKTITIILTALCVSLGFALISASKSTRVIIMPYSVATSTGHVTVDLQLTGEIRDTPQEYIANLAIADLGLILNYTPENVETQFRRFLNRLTTPTYGKQSSALLAEAATVKMKDFSQYFAPSSSSSNEKALVVSYQNNSISVRVTGQLIRMMAGKEVARNTVVYTLTYTQESDGRLSVDAITNSSR